MAKVSANSSAAQKIGALLGPAVLLRVKKGEKRPVDQSWQKLTIADMSPEYLARFNGSNIGVSLGEPSGGLCSIDFDDDDELDGFLTSNPTFRESLLSRGARGGNVWLRIAGNFPKPGRLTRDGKAIGEFRGTGNQTVIHGTHPSGCQYQHNEKPPLQITFNEIQWPDGLCLPWKPKPVEKISPQGAAPEDSDLGRAQRFVDTFSADIRHIYQWNKWLVFEDGRWNAENDGAIFRLADELCRKITDEALASHGAAERKAAMKRAAQWGDIRITKSMLESAKNDRRVIAKPEQLDENPWHVGARNGFVDLRTGEFFGHSRDHLITKFVGADFNPEAKAERWVRFLEEILPDEEVRDFVWKSAGYSLTGLTTEQFFNFLHGGGANGKSTFLEILNKAFGSYAGRAGSRLLYAIDHHGTPDDQMAELFGRRLIIGSETQEGTRMNEGALKDITGGDMLRGCRKYENGFSFQSTAKLWVAGNHKPSIRGIDDGIWRRVRLIPFERQFKAEERDPNLRETLLSELPGILNWLIQGARLWQNEGLEAPAAVRMAVEDYRSEEDTLGDFISECTQTARGSTVPHAELFKAYQKWAVESGIRYPLTSRMMAKQLRERKWRDTKTNKVKCLWLEVSLCNE